MQEGEIKDFDWIRCRDMNGIIELQYMQKKNTECPIQVLPEGRYVLKETGEIFKFKEPDSDSRISSYKSLRRTFKNLRYIINNNFIGAKNELFLTLTYGHDKGKRLKFEDSKEFYNDFKIFMILMRRKYGRIEYINVVEPHEDGHLHAHVLMKFLDISAVFIPNEDIAKIWGHGFVVVSSLKDVDNIGAYVSAYLSDVEVSEKTVMDSIKANERPEIKEVDGKSYIKGGRLKYYPKKFNLYRASRGIVKPEILEGIAKNIKKEVGIPHRREPDFRKKYDIEIGDFKNTIIYEHFNTRKL